jgi:hypothetical protein
MLLPVRITLRASKQHEAVCRKQQRRLADSAPQLPKLLRLGSFVDPIEKSRRVGARGLQPRCTACGGEETTASGTLALQFGEKGRGQRPRLQLKDLRFTEAQLQPARA